MTSAPGSAAPPSTLRRVLGAVWRTARKHPKATAIVVVVFLVIGAVGAVIDRTVLSPTNIPMPMLVGVRLDEAHDRLDDLGVMEVDDKDAFEDRLIIIDSNWSVVRQEPKAGTLVNRHTKITLRAGKTDDSNTAAALGRPLQTTSAAPSSSAPPAPTATVTVTASATPATTPAANPTLPKGVAEFAAWWVGGAGTNFAAVTEVLNSLQGAGVETVDDLIPYCRRLGDAVLVANEDLPSPDDDTTDALRLAYNFYARGADNCINGDLTTSTADINLGAEQVKKADARLRELLTEAGVTPP